MSSNNPAKSGRHSWAGPQPFTHARQQNSRESLVARLQELVLEHSRSAATSFAGAPTVSPGLPASFAHHPHHNNPPLQNLPLHQNLPVQLPQMSHQPQYPQQPEMPHHPQEMQAQQLHHPHPQQAQPQMPHAQQPHYIQQQPQQFQQLHGSQAHVHAQPQAQTSSNGALPPTQHDISESSDKPRLMFPNGTPHIVKCGACGFEQPREWTFLQWLSHCGHNRSFNEGEVDYDICWCDVAFMTASEMEEHLKEYGCKTRR